MKNISGNCLLALCLAFVLISCKETKKEEPFTKLPYSTPERQGVGTESILCFLEAVEVEELELHSFMYVRHGRIVTEAWWEPYKSDINHIMYSASKTFTSTAIGFAVDEKLLSVDDKVISFFPDDLPAEVSPYLKELSVKHLLTMSAGHESPPSLTMADENWVKSFLATPIVNEPGTVFSYSSPSSYMLSAIIQKVTGQTTFEYLKPRLFEPLGMENIQWEEGAQGISYGGGGMRIKTSDMAKFGQFYLQKGVWNGKQLLSPEWIEEASSAQIYQVKDPTEEQKASDEGAQGYGYQIWRCTTPNAYRADGANGQYILIMPDQDAVIAVTARVENMRRILRLIKEHLLPGMLKKALRSDEKRSEFLVAKISSLQIPNPFFTDEENVIPKKDLSQSYVFEPNEKQIESITFSFEPNSDCTITMKMPGKEYNYLFGLDAWRYGTTERLGPYFLDPRRNPAGLAPFTVAGYGSWTKQDELSLRLLYVTEIQHETYICNFKDNQVTIRISNSLQPDVDPVVLTGKLQ